MKIRVGDLVPGTFASGFTGLTYTHYEETFRLLEDSPETPYTFWPIYLPWHDAHVAVFGRPIESADSWAFPGAATHFYRMFLSFRKHGYRPDMGVGAEVPIQVQRHEGLLCVVQGNKRVALIRAFLNLDYMLEVAEVAAFMPRGIE